jgi:hypothetical protein
MTEKLQIASIIGLSALPAIGFGIACITGRWLPQQFAQAANVKKLQMILGFGMLSIGLSILLFAAAIGYLPSEHWLVAIIVFTFIVTTDAILMMILLQRRHKAKS